jgi:hypothetical protein
MHDTRKTNKQPPKHKHDRSTATHTTHTRKDTTTKAQGKKKEKKRKKRKEREMEAPLATNTDELRWSKHPRHDEDHDHDIAPPPPPQKRAKDGEEAKQQQTTADSRNALAAAALRAKLTGAITATTEHRQLQTQATTVVRIPLKREDDRRSSSLRELVAAAADDDDQERKPTRRQTERKRYAQEQRAIRQHITQEQRLAACCLCLDSGAAKQHSHLTLSLGELTYLALPARGSLCEGHCLIVPVQHTAALRSADENVLDEVARFRAGLAEMFRHQSKGVLFLETAMQLQRQRHTFVDVVPLPAELAAQAPAYFKEALLSADAEWAQHKKIIDQPPGKPLSACIPQGFPYFAVSFGGQHGFVHVIEDEQRGGFPWHFGRSVVAGMLRLSPEVYLKPKPRGSLEDDRAAVSRFLKLWAPFDWTASLEGGSYT